MDTDDKTAALPGACLGPPPAAPAMEKALHNFSRVSARDSLAFASSRPGFPGAPASGDAVAAWTAFMKSRGIARVLSLLGDDEARRFYDGLDLDAAMRAAFGDTRYTRVSVFAGGARDAMRAALAGAREADEAIVMHCSGGEGRVTLAMALWLVDGYGLAAQDAVREIEDQIVVSEGVVRRSSVAKVRYLLDNGSMTGFSK